MITRWSRLAEAILTSTHILCFEQIYEKYPNFYLNNNIFSDKKFSVYLNLLVFVILCLLDSCCFLLETHNTDNYQT